MLSLPLTAAHGLSFTDKLVLALHIAFVIFAIGPVSMAVMSTPRYIRQRNLVVLRYLYRITRILALISLLVLVFGIILAQQLDDFAKPWLTASMTLFVVAIVLLVIIIRDQRRAIGALETAEAAAAVPPGMVVVPAEPAPVSSAPAADAPAADVPAADAAAEGAPAADAAAGGPAGPATGSAATAQPQAAAQGQPAAASAGAEHVASVERGRVAMLGGIVSVIWLVILVLMVWH